MWSGRFMLLEVWLLFTSPLRCVCFLPSFRFTSCLEMRFSDTGRERNKEITTHWTLALNKGRHNFWLMEEASGAAEAALWGITPITVETVTTILWFSKRNKGVGLWEIENEEVGCTHGEQGNTLCCVCWNVNNELVEHESTLNQMIIDQCFFCMLYICKSPLLHEHGLCANC